MTLMRGSRELVERAGVAGALAAFSIYTAEQAFAVTAAAEQLGEPVILQAGSSAFSHCPASVLGAIALSIAEQAHVAVGVHLDHSRDIAEVRTCLDLGYTSVMFDGSNLPFAENLRLTTEVVELARPYGAWVEGELGGVPGDEDVSGRDALGSVAGEDRTDPGLARTFVEESGVDALAVSVGNVHGIPAKPIEIDHALLRRLSESVPAPLVLHGASGLADSELRRATAGTVGKVNVNAELRRAFLQGIRESSATDDNLPRVMRSGMDAAGRVAADKLRVLGARASEVPA